MLTKQISNKKIINKISNGTEQTVILKNLNTSYKGKDFSVISIPNEIPCLRVNKIFNIEKNMPNIIVFFNLNFELEKSLK